MESGRVISLGDQTHHVDGLIRYPVGIRVARGGGGICTRSTKIIGYMIY